ncbi:Uncharacterized conserved protein YecT, DUF1311 family [Faunimonas pinastri]|uniref:Uncharacterized conserved protein YecT, DUF1311 family n=1 Tax=Faunimonas pinastri TaxID=1855383 RepID=A0A1H9JKW6_9HYPH|nr:lysozyme inhibitor LprI family protein [Faunimonas pinastri]SEQ87544.1 Uncharacterized conserved protein YecT, DUF1311 family [Faunimonas pinastri]
MIPIRPALAALLLTAATPALAASDAPEDPTAKTLDACLNSDRGTSTAGMTDCEDTAAKDYDRRLNKAYGALVKALAAPAAEKLKLSQRAWLAFRDSERKTQSALFETLQGTMYVPMQADEVMALTRERALRLESYLRVLATGP